MSKTIRVGVIGAGQIARGHCRDINRHARARATCVADLSKPRAEALRKEFAMDRLYTRWEDLVADPEVDAVSVALPNFLHAPVSIAALKAGKHVILDKPFALNAAEARQVVAASKKHRRQFMLGMNWRFEPTAQAFKTLARRGEFGEIYHGKAFWYRRSGIPKFGTWFCRKDMAGGGALLDIGVHMLDVALYVMDNWDPVRVSGATYAKFGPRGLGEGTWGMSDRGKQVFDVDDFATSLIRFRNGATLQLDVTWACHRETKGDNNVQLFGTKAGGSLSPLKLFRYARAKGEYEVVEPQNVKTDFPNGNRFAHWIDVVLGKAKPMCTMEQALTVQRILDGIYKSSETGREVAV